MKRISKLLPRVSKLLLGLLVASALSVLAAPQVSPQGIIVNPLPTDLQVETWVNKDPSGAGTSVYQIGENISLYAKVNQDAYVYLFNLNASGQIDLILPNPYDRSNLLKGGETRAFPPIGARYTLSISGPEGWDKVLAVASRQPLSLDQIADIRSGQARIQGEDNLARSLSIIVSPLPQRDWVSDAVSYRVVRGLAIQPQPPVVQPLPQPPVVVVPPTPQPPVMVVPPAPQPPLTILPQPSTFIVVAPIPGLRIVWEEKKAKEYTVDYQGGNSYHIYDYYHRDLLAKGWLRSDFDSKGSGRGSARLKLQGQYRKGNERMGLLVVGHRGQVEVTLYRD
jgi:hypothetical protein